MGGVEGERTSSGWVNQEALNEGGGEEDDEVGVGAIQDVHDLVDHPYLHRSEKIQRSLILAQTKEVAKEGLCGEARWVET